MIKSIGIDFGTTNSVVALLHADGTVTTARHAAGDTLVDVFRSILCFWTEEGRGRQILRHAAGPEAITAYLDEPLDSRLIMSMKTFLAQKSFTETRIFGRLSAWQNWIFIRPNAVGPDGALKVYGTGAPTKFNWERV